MNDVTYNTCKRCLAEFEVVDHAQNIYMTCPTCQAHDVTKSSEANPKKRLLRLYNYNSILINQAKYMQDYEQVSHIEQEQREIYQQMSQEDKDAIVHAVPDLE